MKWRALIPANRVFNQGFGSAGTPPSEVPIGRGYMTRGIDRSLAIANGDRYPISQRGYFFMSVTRFKWFSTTGIDLSTKLLMSASFVSAASALNAFASFVWAFIMCAT